MTLAAGFFCVCGDEAMRVGARLEGVSAAERKVQRRAARAPPAVVIFPVLGTLVAVWGRGRGAAVGIAGAAWMIKSGEQRMS